MSERRIFILLNGSYGVGKRAVSRALIRLASSGAALDGHALLQVHPPPATIDTGVARLCQIVPALIETHLESGVGLFVLAHACQTGAQVRALRAAVRPLVNETSAYRLKANPAAIRSRFLGVNAGKRFELWRTLDELQKREARLGDLGQALDSTDGDVARLAGAIWADRNRSVVIAEPDPRWPDVFDRESLRTRTALGDALQTIHHIGSTSVEGLPAKPIIDMMAEVASLGAARALVGALAEIGYVFNDHPENTDRMIFTLHGDPKAHLHLVAENSVELDRHLAFRDALREDTALRDAYAELKRGLALRHPGDRQGYCDGKDDFIRAAERRLAR